MLKIICVGAMLKEGRPDTLDFAGTTLNPLNGDAANPLPGCEPCK